MNWKKKLLKSPLTAGIAKHFVAYQANKQAESIADHFIRFLEPQVATNEQLKQEVYKIRHNVYCEELAFEEVDEKGMETDEFDAHSIFTMIKHKPTDNYTSCVRLVKSSSEDELLPIEKFCSHAIDQQEFMPSNFKRSEICEISRLAVKADFRRRKADQFKGAATGVISEVTYSEEELRCFPFIAIGLYMAAAAMAIDNGVKHVFVMMEPRLARSMKFVGINFTQIGKPVDYHGLRAAYHIDPDDFLADLSSGFKSLYNEINNRILAQIEH